MREVGRLGFEGIIAKKSDSAYAAGRASNWLKIKAKGTGDYVIVGFTQPKGSRVHLGGLQLAEFADGRLVYVGRVGTGMDDRPLSELMEMLMPLIRRDPPCHGMATSPSKEPLPREQIPDTKTTTSVEPEYVVKSWYRTITPAR